MAARPREPRCAAQKKYLVSAVLAEGRARGAAAVAPAQLSNFRRAASLKDRM